MHTHKRTNTHTQVKVDLINRNTYLHTLTHALNKWIFLVVSAHSVMRGFSTFGSGSYANNSQMNVCSMHFNSTANISVYVCVSECVCAQEFVYLLYAYEQYACMSGWRTGWLSMFYSTSLSYFLACSFHLYISKKKIKRQFQTAVNYYI